MVSIKTWINFRWRKLRKLDCPKCKTALGDYGYCSPCNRFPHRKWITGAEDIFITDIAFMREHPEEYEKQEPNLLNIS